jgi:hypothetical protein
LVPTTRASKPSMGALCHWSSPLPLRDPLGDVHHHDAAGELLLGDPLRGRRADVSGAHDRNLVDHALSVLG